MRRIALLAVLVVILGLPSHASAVRAQSAPGVFDGLSFLLGTWDAVPDPVSGTGWCAFALDLQGHAVVRTNHADTPAANGRPAAKHDDLMVIYKDGATIRADYWDNEDHLIHYTVTTPAPNTAVFLSPSTAAAPGYRITYKLDGPKVVSGQFDFSAPGTTVFANYLSWKMNKR